MRTEHRRKKDWFDYLLVTVFTLIVLLILAGGIWKEYLQFASMLKYLRS